MIKYEDSVNTDVFRLIFAKRVTDQQTKVTGELINYKRKKSFLNRYMSINGGDSCAALPHPCFGKCYISYNINM